MKRNEDIIKKHHDMVLRLKKPGQKILESLTAWDCDFMHMAGCLPGEASELYDEIENNSTDLIEELGDFAFYLVACRAILKTGAWTGETGGQTSPHRNSVQLMRLGGHFWDVVKRAVVYRKPIDKPDSKYQGRTLEAVAKEYLDQMEQCFGAILTYYSYTLDEILEANYHKLADADTGRYSSGSYSDKEAQERKDKQGR